MAAGLNLIYLLLLLSVFAVHANQESKTAESSTVSNDAVSSSQQVALFQRLFNLKRTEQKDAVQRLLNMKQPEKQLKLLEITVKNIIDVLMKSRIKLESSGYIPGDGIPAEEGLRDAVSSMAENTAFLGDLVLYLPDATARLLRNNEWNNTLKWSLGFCREVPFLDQTTKKMIHLVAQELNLVERDPSYVNPYAKRNQRKEVPEQDVSDKKKKRKKLSKGPSLSGARIQDEL